MPEGHVIHRLANALNRDFRGGSLRVSSPQGRFAAEASLLDGRRLLRAEALGKHLFLDFDTGEPRHLVYIHLGLIGRLRIAPSTEASSSGQARLRIDNGVSAASLSGPQWCRLIGNEEHAEVVAKAGEDPLREDAEPERLWPKVTRSRRSIASLLMDQSLFAGVGNIYRAETLFRLGISPFRAGQELSAEEREDIWHDLVHLMGIGVERGRIDTVRPEHMPEMMGRPPRKDDHGGEVYVYRRAGLPCYVCGTAVEERLLEGRNLFWCASCQKR